MKRLKTFAVAIAVLAGAMLYSSTSAQPGFRANVSFNTFYNELSPYGRWVDMPRFGRVWIYRDRNFRPYYTNGRWDHTDLGWAWESEYPWGWAPFHYGRWEHDPYYGWFWIPGYEYAPAWVVWSEADDYYGWAPLGFGIDINISLGRIPSDRWMYAQRRYMGYRRIDRYCAPYERRHVYYQRQRPIVNVNVYNNVRYGRGPDRNYRSNGSRPDRNAANRNFNNRNYDNRNYNNRNDATRDGRISDNDNRNINSRPDRIPDNLNNNNNNNSNNNNDPDPVVSRRVYRPQQPIDSRRQEPSIETHSRERFREIPQRTPIQRPEPIQQRQNSVEQPRQLPPVQRQPSIQPQRNSSRQSVQEIRTNPGSRPAPMKRERVMKAELSR